MAFAMLFRAKPLSKQNDIIIMGISVIYYYPSILLLLFFTTTTTTTTTITDTINITSFIIMFL